MEQQYLVAVRESNDRIAAQSQEIDELRSQLWRTRMELRSELWHAQMELQSELRRSRMGLLSARSERGIRLLDNWSPAMIFMIWVNILLAIYAWTRPGH